MIRVRFYYEGSSISRIHEYDELPEIGTEVGVMGRPRGGNNPMVQLHKIASIKPNTDGTEVDYVATTKFVSERQL